MTEELDIAALRRWAVEEEAARHDIGTTQPGSDERGDAVARWMHAKHEMNWHFNVNRSTLLAALDELERLRRECVVLRKVIQEQLAERERLVAEAMTNHAAALARTDAVLRSGVKTADD